jgi:dephospho-CoA kinase
LNPLFKLGVTGGIGSGKTSVCRVFEVMNIPVFSTDRVASEIMETDNSIIDGINTIAGRNLYLNGKLDRPALSKLIFNDRERLGNVNSLVHPAVFRAFTHWISLQSSPYVIMEAAILFESGASTLVDKIATVVAPVEERINRIIQRSLLSRDQIAERMRNQMDDAERAKHSDFIIHNSENDMIIPVILKIHTEIINTIKTQI